MKLKNTEPDAALLRSPSAVIEYMRTAEASNYTGLSASTLAKLRMRHNRCDGPKFLKISGCVIYRRSDLDVWMDDHVMGPEGPLG